MATLESFTLTIMFPPISDTTVTVRGYELSLRKADAEMIEVE